LKYFVFLKGSYSNNSKCSGRFNWLRSCRQAVQKRFADSWWLEKFQPVSHRLRHWL